MNKEYSFVKLQKATMEKISRLSKNRETKDQIVRNNSTMVTSLINEAYDTEIIDK